MRHDRLEVFRVVDVVHLVRFKVLGVRHGDLLARRGSGLGCTRRSSSSELAREEVRELDELVPGDRVLGEYVRGVSFSGHLALVYGRGPYRLLYP